jgi:hypothetical protein
MPRNTLQQVIDSTYQEIYVYKPASTTEASREWASSWPLVGIPTGGIYTIGDISGSALYMSTTGAIQYVNASPGKYNYVSSFQKTINTPSSAGGGACPTMLLDRLWQNTGISVTTTTAQTINSSAWPARDNSGLSTGYSVYVALEVGATTTNASAVTTIQISYTNTDGVSGRTGYIPTFPATAVANTFCPFSIQGPDRGVKSIESITLGTSLGAGTVHLVVYRYILGHYPLMSSIPTNIYTSGFNKIYNDSCLFLPTCSSSASVAYVATMRLFEA